MKNPVLFNRALFIKSALLSDDFPLFCNDQGTPLPLISLMGRSNVGKSSLINHLLSQRKLAKTSSVPGKTQLLNFFEVDRALIIVDFPGYGYARAPRAERDKWADSIAVFFETVDEKAPILLLLDSRHLPSAEDLEKLEWIHRSGRPFGIVLTKTDKLTAKQLEENEKAILNAVMQVVPKEGIPYIHFSITNTFSRKQLIDLINYLIKEG